MLVLYGTSTGLTTARSALITETSVEIATGDADGDGVDDVALGQPFAPVSGDASAGQTFVRYGSETQMCAGLFATVDLALGESPTEGDDVIVGTDGDDTINALGGDDIICAPRRCRLDPRRERRRHHPRRGWPPTTSAAGAAATRSSATVAPTRSGANSRPDTIRGGSGGDTIFGGKGGDDIRGNGGSDTIRGNSGADTIEGKRVRRRHRRRQG